MSLALAYQRLLTEIQRVAHQYDQPTPHLLAVSKKHSAAAIRELFNLGQVDFGESYWQETEEKQQLLKDLAITWHFIGPLQSNKTRAIAENFTWVHSVSREKIAQRLSEQRPAELAPLNICIQVNIDAEASKSGVATEKALDLAHKIAKLPNLRLRGLMCIPRPRSEFSEQLHAFQKVKKLQQDLIEHGIPLDTLSMGMSADWQAAVAAGSQWIRIGTALFGERQKNLTKLS